MIVSDDWLMPIVELSTMIERGGRLKLTVSPEAAPFTHVRNVPVPVLAVDVTVQVAADALTATRNVRARTAERFAKKEIFREERTRSDRNTKKGIEIPTKCVVKIQGKNR